MEQAPGKNEKTQTPSAAVDGTRVRSIRETKKLTQLYVASVVGVTTDTISRWENNRYPSIKRDNAEKLAQALEVPLEEILRQEEPDQAVAPSPPPERSARGIRQLLLFGVVTLTALLLVVYLLSRNNTPTPRAARWLPHYGAPGEIIPVQIKITREGGESLGLILKEKLPPGWRLVSANPAASSSDPADSGIKWLIPGGSPAVNVSYTVQIPAAPPRGEANLQGEIVLHATGTNRTEAVSGDHGIRIGAYHWADANGDGRIDDDEIMPAYYVCEDIKSLDWKTIEAIWSGKGYRWDPAGGFTVVK